MLFILGRLFDQLIGKTVDSVTRAAETKIRRETIGKAEGRINRAESEMRQRAIRGVDRGIDNAVGRGRGGGQGGSGSGGGRPPGT